MPTEKFGDRYYMSCNEAANEYIADFLMNECGLVEDETKCTMMMCTDGIARNLYIVPPRTMSKFKRAKRMFPHWDFNFFVKSSPGARPSPTNIFDVTRRRMSKKQRDTFDALGTEEVDSYGKLVRKRDYPQF